MTSTTTSPAASIVRSLNPLQQTADVVVLYKDDIGVLSNRRRATGVAEVDIKRYVIIANNRIKIVDIPNPTHSGGFRARLVYVVKASKVRFRLEEVPSDSLAGSTQPSSGVSVTGKSVTEVANRFLIAKGIGSIETEKIMSKDSVFSKMLKAADLDVQTALFEDYPGLKEIYETTCNAILVLESGQPGTVCDCPV